MASSFHILAAGICLAIFCAARLSLTAPVEETPQTSEVEDEYDDVVPTETTPTDEKNSTTFTKTQSNVGPTADEPSSISGSSTNTTSTSKTSSSSASSSGAELHSSQAGSSSKAKESSTATSALSTATTPEVTKGTKPEEQGSTEESDNGPTSVENEDSWFPLPWSHSTWASVVVPISVGLGSALFLIAWICCVRRICCRKCSRWRSPPYKERLRSTSGPPKKALREDFRQMRAKDRMKLLAESSDEEF